MYIYIPSQVFNYFGLNAKLSLFSPKFYYLMSHVQIPFEIFVFHLAMLSFLEKYKNKIGELQHKWIKFIGEALGIGKSLIPYKLKRSRVVNVVRRKEKELLHAENFRLREKRICIRQVSRARQGRRRARSTGAPAAGSRQP